MSSVGRRILVVEDNVGLALLCQRMLESLGPHDVSLAHTGQAAFDLFVAIQPDVILLDIGLPDISGYQVARLIRQHTQGAQVLLVAVTGYGDAEDRNRALEAGFDEHLAKPPSVQAFRQLLEHPKLPGGTTETKAVAPPAEHESERDRSPTSGSADGVPTPATGTSAVMESSAAPPLPDATAAEEESLALADRLGTIAHDLGNVNYVIDLCATILAQSKDVSQMPSTSRMLKELEPSVQKLVTELREIRQQIKESR